MDDRDRSTLIFSSSTQQQETLQEMYQDHAQALPPAGGGLFALILASFEPRMMRETLEEVVGWFSPLFHGWFSQLSQLFLRLFTELVASFALSSIRETLIEVRSWLPPIPSFPKRVQKVKPIPVYIFSPFATVTIQTCAHLPAPRPWSWREVAVLRWGRARRHDLVLAWMGMLSAIQGLFLQLTTHLRRVITVTHLLIEDIVQDVSIGLRLAYRPALRSLGQLLFVISISSALFMAAPFLALEARGLVYRVTQPFLSSAEPTGKPILVQFPEMPDPDKEFHVRIPLIGVDANVTPNVDINDSKAYDEVLKTGVAHAAGTGFPDHDGGKNKTIFIFSHSTIGSWNITKYNALFYSLKDILVEDQIQIWFWGKEYWYKVVEKRIVEPNDTTFLASQTEKERLVLQTCWPPGTLSKRLIVIAERVGVQDNSLEK